MAAIRIDTQPNPNPSKVGTRAADATIIYSGITGGGVIVYQLVKKNGNDQTITLTSNVDISGYNQVVSISDTKLEIILDFRTEYRVRIKNASGDWGLWTTFKTRDKRYTTPDAITQLHDDTSTTAKDNGVNRIINVSNTAKARVITTARGATVINTDTGYVNTTSISYTSRGATVYNRS